MSSDFELIHLTGSHFSGRAVKFQPLDPDECDVIAEAAGKSVDADSSMLDLKREEWKLGVRQMIKAVSEPLPIGADPNGADVKWTKVSAETLNNNFSELFTTKDARALQAVYRDFHEVSNEEIKLIVGKALTVTA